MEDTSYARTKDAAIGIGELLDAHKGVNVLVLDLSGLNAWTDFFVIATVTSSTHLQGLQRHLKEYVTARGIEILRRQRRIPSDEEWSLVDMGNIVVHLMTERARGFYDLERLWGDGEILWRAGL